VRTTITIEADRVNRLLEETGAKSKTKAVSIAIDEYLRRKQLAKVSQLRGKLDFELTANEIRHFER
jgi:hypothetical protein